MGFSTTAAHAIFFIAAVIIAAGVAGVVSDASQTVETGISQKSNLISERLNTEIKVIHVYPGSDNTSVYILNAGSTVLTQDSLILFLDGKRVSILGTRIVNRSTNIDNSLWDPGEVLEANITALSSGRYVVKALVKMDVWDEYYFNT
jgi:flagellar protein FlaG